MLKRMPILAFAMLMILTLSVEVFAQEKNNNIATQSANKSAKVVGLRKATFSFLGGKATLTDDDFGVENSGSLYHLGMRYYFSHQNPRQSRFFAGLSYSSAMGSAYKRFTLDIGRTTKILRNKAYFYGLVGIGDIIRSDDDSAIILRVGIGNAYRITPRFGIELYTGLDIIYIGQKEEFPGDPQPTPVTDGGLWDLKLGLTFEL